MMVEINEHGLRYGCMRLMTFILILLAHKVDAQEWSACAGAGLTCQGFFVDKSVFPASAKIPFSPGAGVNGGIKYTTDNGFDAFLDISGTYTYVKYPVPDVQHYWSYFNIWETRLMAGAGPRIPAGQDNATITPFLKLGASYFNFWDSNASDEGDGVTVARQEGAYRHQHWAIACAVGAEWYFEAAVPSSIGVQLTYSAQNILKDPLAYTAATQRNNYDLFLQGKLFQFMLSYNVHWKFKR